MPAAHLRLPTGAITPTGWLGAQLQLAADGLTGHLSDFYPDVANSSWIGGDADGSPQERAPYWMRGSVPLAHALGDSRLQGEVQRYVDYALTHADPSGWLGPAASGDRQYWGRYPFLNALQYHYESTRDERIPAAMVAHVLEQARRMWSQPICGPTVEVCMWSSSRVHDAIATVAWLIEETDAGAAAASDLWAFADLVWAQRGIFDWETFFASRDFPAGAVFNPYGNNSAARLIVHGVDVAEAMKSGAVWWRFWGGSLLKGSIDRAPVVEGTQGQPTGEICGDEHLCGTDPSQGTELCAIVELIASHAYTAAVAGDAAFYERVEKLAFNTLPASYTKDMTAHPYLHQGNEIRAVQVNPPPWYTDGGGANMYGIDAGHTVGCCTTNGGQGWPQALSATIRATPDAGVAIGLLAPVSAVVALRSANVSTAVRARDASAGRKRAFVRGAERAPPPVFTGVNVTVDVTTAFPFNDTLLVSVSNAPASMPLYLRIPSWVSPAASVAVNGGAPVNVASSAGSFLLITLPAGASSIFFDTAPVVRIAPAHNGSIVVSRGALIYSLFVGENVTQNGNPFPAWPPGMDYKVENSTAWNYALVIADVQNPAASFNFTRRGAPGPQPFEGGVDAVPVFLTAWARKVGAWGEVRNGAAPPPASPVCGVPEDACGDLELVTLVPHGSTLLRMTALPYTEH